MGENEFASLPIAAYGLVSFCAAIAYYILQRLIIRSQGDDSALAQAIGRDLKGKIGFYENGRRITENLLKDGWSVCLGNVEYVFHEAKR